MHIHHFYPRTRNIGDHFVQAGIASLVHSVAPEATFELFDVNSRGENRSEYGLSRFAIERANRDADLFVVGGSNLYEGAFGWSWGVKLDSSALEHLRTRLFLIGIGTGSSFASSLHKPSRSAKAEITRLNNAASLSWVRDVITLEWLQNLGIDNAEMLGDPATYIFQAGFRQQRKGDYVLIVVPPARIWKSRRGFWQAARWGRPLFHAFVKLAQQLSRAGHAVLVACNDPSELGLTIRLFKGFEVVCPKDTKDYFEVLSRSRVVVSGRLHTAAVSLSMGIPFLLIDLDQRTHGFIETYQLAHAAISPQSDVTAAFSVLTHDLLSSCDGDRWNNSISIRDKFYCLAKDKLRVALGA